ncbi:hypothetical protein DW981_12445 [Clostridium sp. AM49-4BH]|nr:hypothetical protein DW981_12445 [Clostridium sp. AM49-4BH]
MQLVKRKHMKRMVEMRLYNIYYLCNASVDGIRNLNYKQNHYANGKSDYTLENWKGAVQSYDVIRKIPFLSNEVKELIDNVPAYVYSDASPKVNNETAEIVKQSNVKLLAKLEAIIELYQSMDAGESQEGVDIKIPACSTLDEYIGYLKDINFILNQCPMIANSSEQVVFNTVDVGSMWLSLLVKGAVGSHIILNILAKLSEVSIKFLSDYRVLKMQDEYLVAMRQKNEIGEEVLDTFKKLKETMMDEKVSEFEKECDTKITDPEERDRTARTIEKLAILVDKGVEIYSSIETPDEIKVMFPFTENAPLLPEGLQKLIEAKEENDR